METHEETRTNVLLRLVVYGTLKRGYWNHECFCRKAVSIEDAIIRGRLYELPSGIPVLRVPDSDIIAVGTCDPLADTATQEQLAEGLVEAPDNWCADEYWDWIHGELMTFDDPGTRLPRIDSLESFCPGRPSLYRRVLVPAICDATVVPAWCYVADEALLSAATPTGKTSWP